MLSRIVCFTAVLIMASPALIASAQTPAPAAPAATTPAPAKMKLTKEKLKEMRAKWSANKPQMKACRKDAKAKGLDGDDRWFFIEDCMSKS